MPTPLSPPQPASRNSSSAPNVAHNAFNLFPWRLLQEKKEHGEPIAMISLYDAPSARLACEAGADVLLVGDSLGNVILGYENTINVSMQDMVRHTGAVVRGVRQSQRPTVPVVADLPFGGYAGSRKSITRNAVALMQEGAHAVKLEGASQSTLRAVRIIQEMGAPVIGHLGFTPQSVLNFSRVVQGRSAQAAIELWNAALALQAAGCCAIVLEAVPSEVAQEISNALTIPTIGIGAGGGCNGQVLVWHDLVGLSLQAPRFVKAFAQAHEMLAQAAADYVREVQNGEFPASQHSWPLNEDEQVAWQKFVTARRQPDTT